ncbi:regulator of RNase E activity RraA [Rhizobium etli]|uniref:Regulator of RNase E activity RraA n=1 Tax=Rhizobium etli TaxID=29449 RepID=A0A7W7EGW0_RHIET|nr:regulator of RNase E activity RraA [Rhizobium etli]MBB4538562.1 regulator of RNase E activity RraA [Rhizobium etli]
MTLDAQTIATLKTVSTATLTTVLLKKGLRNVWIRGAVPLKPGQPRIVGPAFTLRFVPAREDLATPASWASPISTRAAIEAMPEGCVAVVDAMGVTDAGIFGDILCARMQKRGVAALVTDGVVRDLAGVLDSHLPVWCRGVAAPLRSPASHSSPGSSRSVAAASRSSPMTSSSSTRTARC